MKVLVMGLTLCAAAAAAAAPLELVATIEMPAVKGRIDHLAADVKGRRLFVAALGNDTVEVLDVAANRHLRSLAGFGEPQGLAYLAQFDRLYVANGAAGRVDVLDGTSFSTLKRLGAMSDSDNVRYDAATQTVVVGYGKGALRFLSAPSAEPLMEVRLGGHPESFQLDTGSKRIYVNVPTARHVAVVDAAKGAVTATWPVPGAVANFPMALDASHQRLFVGARLPAVLLVYDTQSGSMVSKLSIGGDTDDLFYDEARKRIYIVCGEGRVDVLRQESADRYALETSVKTGERARTGLFVPADGRLYVAAPANGAARARVLVYRVN
jgi:DNA-binding beta-propeller fold protein YncE